jgi:hypothetical protein
MSARKLRAVATSLVLVAAGSLSATAATAPAEAAQATDPIEVSIKKRVITMPTTIQPGVNEFHVTTTSHASDFQLLMPAAGYTTEEAARDAEKGIEQGRLRALRRFEANVTLYGGAPALGDRPGVMWATLPVGTFWAVDTHASPDASRFFAFSVAGADTGNVLPSAPTLKAKGATKWAKRPLSIAHKGTLTFKNASTENHFMEMVRLRKGKTVRDFKKWLLNPQGPSGPPPIDFSRSLFLGVQSPGLSMTADYRLPRGNYVMLCFWPDADEGGTPHAFMGMIRGIALK